ncbi:MAG: PaaI family thioesterase [Bdellovibrionota bacterium]
MVQQYLEKKPIFTPDYVGPYGVLLGMEFLEQDPAGGNVSRLPVTERILSRNRVLHGGAVFGIADTSMGLAFGATCEKGEIGVTNEIKICYFRPVPEGAGALYAFSRVLHRGKRGGTVECELKTPDGKLVGKAIGSFTLIRDPMLDSSGEPVYDYRKFRPQE